MKIFIHNCYAKVFTLMFLIYLATSINTVDAQSNTPLRRPISPSQPMWLIHIDTWNYADPQKIIDLIPEDIRPYVVMNISLSISHNVATSQFQVAEYGYEIAKSWLRVCAQNQMWAIVQHSSGGFAQFSDFDLTVYEEFYNEFPNLIGINYAEQFWGFDDPNDPLSPKWTDRMAHFADLLKLSNRYGGYLVVSWCGNEWSPPINPIGMLKRNPAFAEASEKYTENYLLFEKYTQQSYQSDMESLCLGAYLSGYSGNYGIRYDDTGWTNVNGMADHDSFTMATAGAVHLEHAMLTGQTMIDGPELIWTQCFRETNRKSTTEGYMMRDWETFPQFDNMMVDMFRKILDGTVRIPSRQEVIDRTKVVIVNDVNSGSSDDIYSSPETLFEGLYRMDGDGNLRNNKSFFKKTGRYPTIPTVYGLSDGPANSFQLKVNKSAYSTRWPTISSKVDEFNSMFPEEYTGDLYAGRHENGWVIYNPFKTGQTASASIPFKYNTSERVEISFSQYTSSVMKEFSDKVSFYLNNFDNVLNTGLKTDIIKIYGSTSEPTFTYTDRGDHEASASVVSSDWSDGVFTLTIQHNGPMDITINCAGTATDRLTNFTEATLIEPSKPPVYSGPRQYEAECFDYRNISGITTGGQNGSVRNYSGQGYLRVGTNASASVRDTVYALRSGNYQLITKYSASSGNVNSLDLYVNGIIVATPLFTKTATESDWQFMTQNIELNKGKNVIEFKANSSSTFSLTLDNIVISQGANNGLYDFENDLATNHATNPPADLIAIKSGTAGVVAYTNSEGVETNAFKAYTTGAINNTGVADLEMFNTIAQNYSVTWKEYYTSTGANKGVLLRGTGDHGSCPYAEGLKRGYLFQVTNNNDNTITLKTYIAGAGGLQEKTTFTSDFKVMPDQPCWFRAKAFDNRLVFECSNDSVNWQGGALTSFIDESYPVGSSQLVWGLGSGNLDWHMDNIAILSVNITVSRFKIDNFKYSQGTGPSSSQSFKISGSSLSDDIELSSSEDFEMSLSTTDGFSSSLILQKESGAIPATTIHVRMKSGLPVQDFNGEISVLSGDMLIHTIELNGGVTPQSMTLKYDFTDDAATTSASTPPALNTSIGSGNSATAGVVSYTNTQNETSNALKPYGLGQRNATGVVDLGLFPDNGTDYSVTWKQSIGSAGTEYKIGMLLRGDTENIGTETTGYVQGMMHGYLFIVYHNGNESQFRIYRSNATLNSLNMLVNAGVGTLVPSPGQPVWYRASVSGTTSVQLTFEYSTDGITWKTGGNTTDNTTPLFSSGATQMVWGLAATAIDFYVDDITFKGYTEDSGTLPEVITVSKSSIEGLNYDQNTGGPLSQTFTVSGSELSDNIKIEAPANFEVSLYPNSQYASSISLSMNNGNVSETTVYVRLKPALPVNSYTGEIVISSPGVLTRMVSLSGSVLPTPQIIVSTSTLSGFSYFVDAGPSNSQSFTVSGTELTDDIVVTSSENYEISLNAESDYTSSLSFTQNEGNVASTVVNIRLKAGLEAETYNDEIVITSTGAIDQTISLSGNVKLVTSLRNSLDNAATVIQTRYFTVTGQEIYDTQNHQGLFIVRKLMSDGSIETSKIIILK